MTALRFDLHGRREPDAPTLLLCSGLGGAAGFWRPQLEALAAGYRVIAYDQRGTGRNAQPLADGHSIEDMSDDAEAILDAAEATHCHFVGHALGGLVGLALARRAPQRVRSLTIVNGWGRAGAHTRRCFDARLRLLQQAGARAWCEAQPLFLYPAAWSEARRQQVEAEVEHALAQFPGQRNVLLRVQALLAFDATAWLHALTVPALLYAARDDLLVPWTASEALARQLPLAELAVAEHGGHALCAVDPAAFNATLLSFLARTA